MSDNPIIAQFPVPKELAEYFASLEIRCWCENALRPTPLPRLNIHKHEDETQYLVMIAECVSCKMCKYANVMVEYPDDNAAMKDLLDSMLKRWNWMVSSGKLVKDA